MKKLFFTLFLLPLILPAELEMPSVFSSHMVLQRDRPLPVWGKAAPGSTVTVRFRDQHTTVETAADGRWKVKLEPEAASFDPAMLHVAAGNRSLEFEDVLVGEVWLCSGQSNMAWSVGKSKDADLEISMARLSGIRLYQVQRRLSEEALFSDGGAWKICSPETVKDFSAVGYHFGFVLQRMLGVPIGLIDASWGGTPAIAWTREQAMSRHPLLEEKAREWQEYLDSYEDKIIQWERDLEEWTREHRASLRVRDPGIAEHASRWHEAALNDFDWDTIQLPNTFPGEHADRSGSIWFRRRIALPEAMHGSPLVMVLGPIKDFDTVWVNGTQVGQTTAADNAEEDAERRYRIPSRLTHGGEITIAIRVFNASGVGGFTGEARSMLLVGQNSALRLAGTGWVYRPERLLQPAVDERIAEDLPGAPRKPTPPENSPQRPGVLANSMLAPVAPFALRGALWYQGESDAGWEPERYDERARVMFEDWRDWWEIPDMHLGIVQLASFMHPVSAPSDEAWPRLRESQRRLARDLSYSGLAVTIDVGEANDIHPANKQVVGRRLARWALADIYDRITLRGGPELDETHFESDGVLLSFSQTGGGLHIFDSFRLGGFTLAGSDGEFFPASAEIVSNTQVRVKSDLVSNPVHLRYGWQNNPVEASLFNRERLPASPFEVQAEHNTSAKTRTSDS